MSKLSIEESAEKMSMKDVLETDAGSLKNLLREKWKEVNGD